MPGIAQHLDDSDLDGPLTVLSLADAREEDQHWARSHRRERYFQSRYEYEDYASAYCVGYIGYAQYGGTFEDAERSLISNWIRIKGDSRLSLEEAMPAIRAAWDRLACSCDAIETAPAAQAHYARQSASTSFALEAVPA
ncbi:MAG: hypothetical protein ABIR26_01985 [Ramlibacter sp.]